jgi:hypothetical protein
VKNDTEMFKRIMTQFVMEEDPLLEMLKWTMEQMMHIEVANKVGADKGKHAQERMGGGTKLHQTEQTTTGYGSTCSAAQKCCLITATGRNCEHLRTLSYALRHTLFQARSTHPKEEHYPCYQRVRGDYTIGKCRRVKICQIVIFCHRPLRGNTDRAVS